MKTQFTISVPKPCDQQWSEFQTTANGAFCGSCKTNVVDFTNMSDAEIIQYFKENKGKTCGKFKSNQLTVYQVSRPKQPRNLMWIKSGLISLSLLLGQQGIQAMTFNKPKTEIAPAGVRVERDATVKNTMEKISGIVYDDTNTPLPGVNVVLKGSDVGTVTDVDGKFTFPKELEHGDVLEFTFIGYDKVEYVVPKDLKPQLNINITMVMDVHILGEADFGQPYQEKSGGISGLWQKVKNIF